MSRFASWEQVCAHLRARGATLRPSDTDRVELTLGPAPYAAPGVVATRLTLARIDHPGGAWLELVALIGGTKSLPIANALRENATAAIGSFCFVDGALALRQTLPLPGLRAADLDRAVRVMDKRVTETRKVLGLG